MSIFYFHFMFFASLVERYIDHLLYLNCFVIVVLELRKHSPLFLYGYLIAKCLLFNFFGNLCLKKKKNSFN